MIGLGEISDKEIFTLGIKPSFPSTAFGYVEVAPQSEKKYSLSSKTVYRKTEFRCSNKNYCRKNVFWNAGSFMMSVSTLTQALNIHCPEVFRNSASALEKADVIENKITLNKKYFEACESISIDHAVMEKYKNLKLVELGSDWSDVGSWTSLAKLFPPTLIKIVQTLKKHFFLIQAMLLFIRPLADL